MPNSSLFALVKRISGLARATPRTKTGQVRPESTATRVASHGSAKPGLPTDHPPAPRSRSNDDSKVESRAEGIEAAVTAERYRCARIVAHGVKLAMDEGEGLGIVVSAASFAFDTSMTAEAAIATLDATAALAEEDRKASRRGPGRYALYQEAAHDDGPAANAQSTDALIARARTVYDYALSGNQSPRRTPAPATRRASSLSQPSDPHRRNPMTDYDTAAIAAQPTPTAKLTTAQQQTTSILDTALATYQTQVAALQDTLALVMATMRTGEDITSALGVAPFTHPVSGVLLNTAFASRVGGGPYQPWPAASVVYGANKSIYANQVSELQGVGVPITGVTMTGS